MQYALEGIILKKNRIDERRVVVNCFSREYGKIDIFARESITQTRFDTLTYFRGNILTKDKNSLQHVHVLHPYSAPAEYSIYDFAAWGSATLVQLLPYGLPYPRVFDFLKNILHKPLQTPSDWLLFLVHTCRDFGIVSCDVGQYAVAIADHTNHSKIRGEIEGWITSYKLS